MDAVLPVVQLIAKHPAHARASVKPGFEKGAGYVVDRMLSLDQAGVPLTDLGFMRADAVYDVVTVGRGQFFKLRNHQERFARSCERMRLTNPYDFDQEAQILNDLVAATGLRDAYVWWCVTRGANPANAADRLQPAKFNNRFYAFVIPYIFIKGDEDRIAGMSINISDDFIRIPPGAVDPRAKNFCSLDLAMSLFEAGDSGADWSVLTDGNGALMEAPGCNIFVVKDGHVATPDIGCLEGITRETALELATELGLSIETRRVTVEELQNADEAFLTSSAGGILPISTVSGRPLHQSAGPISTRIHNLYWTKRWEGWCGTPVDYGQIERADVVA